MNVRELLNAQINDAQRKFFETNKPFMVWGTWGKKRDYKLSAEEQLYLMDVSELVEASEFRD